MSRKSIPWNPSSLSESNRTYQVSASRMKSRETIIGGLSPQQAGLVPAATAIPFIFPRTAPFDNGRAALPA